MLRYVSLSKLERLETNSTTSGSASVSMFGTGVSLSAGRSQAIQSRLDRVERALRRQKLLGKVSDPSLFQFLSVSPRQRVYCTRRSSGSARLRMVLLWQEEALHLFHAPGALLDHVYQSLVLGHHHWPHNRKSGAFAHASDERWSYENVHS